MRKLADALRKLQECFQKLVATKHTVFFIKDTIVFINDSLNTENELVFKVSDDKGCYWEFCMKWSLYVLLVDVFFRKFRNICLFLQLAYIPPF